MLCRYNIVITGQFYEQKESLNLSKCEIVPFSSLFLSSLNFSCSRNTKTQSIIQRKKKILMFFRSFWFLLFYHDVQTMTYQPSMWVILDFVIIMTSPRHNYAELETFRVLAITLVCCQGVLRRTKPRILFSDNWYRVVTIFITIIPFLISLSWQPNPMWTTTWERQLRHRSRE